MPPTWNERFATEGYVYGTEPNGFLVSCADVLAPGMTALAVADGEGRNGVWLARQGLDVLSVDGAENGIIKARRLAERHGVALRTEVADLRQWAWPVAAFDIVAALYIHFFPADRPAMHAAMAAALKPDGRLVMEAFHPDQLAYGTGGPPVEEMLYSADMLRGDFADLEIEALDEVEIDLFEGRLHCGPAKVTRLRACRP